MTRWLIGCCIWGLFGLALPDASHAQQSASCRKKLQKKDYQGAASCFQILYRQNPKKISFLRNQGIIHRMWAAKVRAKKPTRACVLLGRAIEIFTNYSKLAKGVDRLEMLSRITKLKSARKLVNLSINTKPENASLLLVGYQYKKKTNAPLLLTGLCPGTYHLRIEHKKYFPRQTTLVLKPGQMASRFFALKSRSKPKPRVNPRNTPPARPECPMEVSHLLGRRGCRGWEDCRRRNGKACAWLSRQFRRRGNERRSISYISMACEINYYPACLQAALMHQNQRRYSLALGYLKKGCKSGIAEICHALADYHAGRYPGYGEGGNPHKRQCRQAVRTYRRACLLGRKESCTSTCNTTNVVLPTLAHAGLHFTGLIVGGLTVTTNSLMGYTFLYGALGTLLEALYLPLWLKAFRTHSLGLQIGLTVTTVIPFSAGLALLIAGLTSNTPGSDLSNHMIGAGLGTLMFALPVHALWVLFTWISYNRHKATIKDMTPAAPKVTWFVTPTFTQESAGFAVIGRF